jgi:hypothetical protein
MGYLPKSMQASMRLSFGSSLLTKLASLADTVFSIVLPNRLEGVAEFSDHAVGLVTFPEFSAIF